MIKPLLIKAAKLTRGNALDIGASYGFDSLFLASKGFKVTAVEKDKLLADQICLMENDYIKVVNKDIADFKFDQYNLVNCSFILHFLRGKARNTLNKIKQITKLNGINLIATFLDAGDFENKHKGLFARNELKELYVGWEILDYFEKEVKTKELNTNGSFKKQMAAFLLARKPKFNFSSFDFIFIGETHGFIEDFYKEKEIIGLVKPNLILSEQLQDIKLDSKEKKLKILKQKKISEIVQLKEVKNLIEICLKNEIKLIGMGFKNFGFDTRLQAIIKGKIESTKKDILEFEKISKKRESQYLRIIQAYRGKTGKPIVILLGTWHLREESPLITDLDSYIVIYPCIKEGEILLEAPKNKEDIKYCHKIKNEKNKI